MSNKNSSRPTFNEALSLIPDAMVRRKALEHLGKGFGGRVVEPDVGTTLDRVLSHSFIWFQTPEGHDYWSDKAKLYSSISILDN